MAGVIFPIFFSPFLPLILQTHFHRREIQLQEVINYRILFGFAFVSRDLVGGSLFVFSNKIRLILSFPNCIDFLKISSQATSLIVKSTSRSNKLNCKCRMKDLKLFFTDISISFLRPFSKHENICVLSTLLVKNGFYGHFMTLINHCENLL